MSVPSSSAFDEGGTEGGTGATTLLSLGCSPPPLPQPLLGSEGSHHGKEVQNPYPSGSGIVAAASPHFSLPWGVWGVVPSCSGTLTGVELSDPQRSVAISGKEPSPCDCADGLFPDP